MPNYYMNSINDMKNINIIDDGEYSNKVRAGMTANINGNDNPDSEYSINKKYVQRKLIDSPQNILDTENLKSLFHGNGLFSRNDIYETSDQGGRLFTHTFRFGLNNTYGALNNPREYIFFTKPDLHIIDASTEGGYKLTEGLESYFWKDLFQNKKRIISLLQGSSGLNTRGGIDWFNHLLQNTFASSTLDVPTLNSTDTETATNSFGVSLNYRGSSEDSDDGPEFSIEFKDDKYLNVYTFFRAYEEYQTLNKHGLIAPQVVYRNNKTINDQFSIYKFIVDEDMETLIYWGKYYGVYPKSLPRDAFNASNFQDGLSFSISFKAAFYEDMRPEILYDFNAVQLMNGYMKNNSNVYHRIDTYNEVLDRIDARPAKGALIYRVSDEADDRVKNHPNKYYYKLVWKGDDIY